MTAVVVEGDSFHRFDRMGMKQKIEEAEAAGNKNLSHFGPENNLFAELEGALPIVWRDRKGYPSEILHDTKEVARYGQPAGPSTAWARSRTTDPSSLLRGSAAAS